MSRSVLALDARGPSGKEVILNEGSMCWHYGWISVPACVRAAMHQHVCEARCKFSGLSAQLCSTFRKAKTYL